MICCFCCCFGGNKFIAVSVESVGCSNGQQHQGVGWGGGGRGGIQRSGGAGGGLCPRFEYLPDCMTRVTSPLNAALLNVEGKGTRQCP